MGDFKSIDSGFVAAGKPYDALTDALISEQARALQEIGEGVSFHFAQDGPKISEIDTVFGSQRTSAGDHTPVFCSYQWTCIFLRQIEILPTMAEISVRMFAKPQKQFSFGNLTRGVHLRVEIDGFGMQSHSLYSTSDDPWDYRPVHLQIGRQSTIDQPIQSFLKIWVKSDRTSAVGLVKNSAPGFGAERYYQFYPSSFQTDGGRQARTGYTEASVDAPFFVPHLTLANNQPGFYPEAETYQNRVFENPQTQSFHEALYCDFPDPRLYRPTLGGNGQDGRISSPDYDGNPNNPAESFAEVVLYPSVGGKALGNNPQTGDLEALTKPLEGLVYIRHQLYFVQIKGIHVQIKHETAPVYAQGYKKPVRASDAMAHVAACYDASSRRKILSFGYPGKYRSDNWTWALRVQPELWLYQNAENPQPLWSTMLSLPNEKFILDVDLLVIPYVFLDTVTIDAPINVYNKSDSVNLVGVKTRRVPYPYAKGVSDIKKDGGRGVWDFRILLTTANGSIANQVVYSSKHLLYHNPTSASGEVPFLTQMFWRHARPKHERLLDNPAFDMPGDSVWTPKEGQLYPADFEFLKPIALSLTADFEGRQIGSEPLELTVSATMDGDPDEALSNRGFTEKMQEKDRYNLCIVGMTVSSRLV